MTCMTSCWFCNKGTFPNSFMARNCGVLLVVPCVKVSCCSTFTPAKAATNFTLFVLYPDPHSFSSSMLRQQTT